VSAKLLSKGVKYVVTTSLIEYAQIAVVGASEEETTTIEEVTKGIGILEISAKSSTVLTPASTPTAAESTTTAARVYLNIDRRKQYEKDCGTAYTVMFQLLSNEDQALADEYKTVQEFWSHLKSKFDKPSKIAAAKYQRNL